MEWFAALALLAEIAIAIAVWRARRSAAGVVTNAAAAFVGLAAASSIGLAAQGAFLFAKGILEPSGLAFVAIWLFAGTLGFAIAVSIKPSHVSGSLPCLFVATLFIMQSFSGMVENAIVLSAVMILSAIILWFCERAVRRRRACSRNGAKGSGFTRGFASSRIAKERHSSSRRHA